MTLFLRGLVIGLGIAAPVGPIGVLCIRRSVTVGRRAGFTCGLGAATADATYGAIAAFGLTAITQALTDHLTLIRIAGGAFLIVLGARTFVAHARSLDEPEARASGGYLSTFLLTLSNPTTILSFAAVFAGIGIGATAPSTLRATALVAGVFLGSAAWWLFLSTTASAMRGRIRPHQLTWINRASGALITGFGVAAIVSTMV